MQGSVQGREMLRRRVAEVSRCDTTRQLNSAQNGGMRGDAGAYQAVDVVGFNSQDGGDDGFHAKHPTTPITSFADHSAFMKRGEFANDTTRNVISSYDCEFAGHGKSHPKVWQLIAERP